MFYFSGRRNSRGQLTRSSATYPKVNSFLWQGLFGRGSMVTSIFGNKTQLKLAATAKIENKKNRKKNYPRQKSNNKILLSESFIMWLQAINFGPAPKCNNNHNGRAQRRRTTIIVAVVGR